jgi:hypothetical protein
VVSVGIPLSGGLIQPLFGVCPKKIEKKPFIELLIN